MSEPSFLLSATMEAFSPPALTSNLSPTMSGDSLMPQVMFEPPNFESTFIVQTVLPVRVSRHERSPLPPSA
jgi:hypothetical protein